MIMRAPRNLAGYDPFATAEGFHFDGRAAERACGFFPRYLRHIKGRIPNQPYVLNPWEKKVTATLFGWKRADGTRRYREAFLAVPRKNNKTTFCAGLSLYTLFCDYYAADGLIQFEEGAEVYCAACDREQASMVFDVAAQMVAKSPALMRRAKTLDAVKRIVFPERGGYMRAIPADAAGSHGFNAHAVVIDELHTQPNRDLYDVLKTSMGARLQPLLVSITTAGHDKQSLCYELWEYARQVRDGVAHDPHFLPVVFEATEEDDWTSRKVWRKANPNYGLSVTAEYLEEAFARAQRVPAFENTFKNLHLNMWTESESRWIGSVDWDACQGPMPDVEGLPCYAGLDLASTDDLTALVVVYRKDDRFYVRPYIFVPEETVATARKRYQSQYREWRERGYLTTTPGASTDYAFVRKTIQEIAHQSRLQVVAMDQWQAADTYNWLEQSGIPALKVSQNFGGLWPGVKAVEEAVLERTLVHDGNPVLRWMVDSTVVDTDAAGNRKPNKKKSHGEHGTKGKIDGVVALVMAMGEAVMTEDTGVPQIF